MAVFFLEKCLRAYSRASIDIGRNVSDKGLIHGLYSLLVVCSFMQVEQTMAQAGGDGAGTALMQGKGSTCAVWTRESCCQADETWGLRAPRMDGTVSGAVCLHRCAFRGSGHLGSEIVAAHHHPSLAR